MSLKIGRYEKDELDIEVYHGDKESVSRTKLMLYDQCPRKFQAMYLTGEMTKEVTKPMILGSAFHTYILEPDLFKLRYGILPEGADRRTKYTRELVDNFTSNGQAILDHDTYQTILKMEASLKSHPEAAALVYEGSPVYERSYIYPDEDSGIIVKARPDIIRHNCFVDLKTCRSADEFNFSQSVVKNGNHLQGAMFQDARYKIDGDAECLTFPVINIAIETSEPYCIGIYFIAQAAIDVGRVRYKAVLKRMAASFVSGVFPSYETKEICLPAWYSSTDDDTIYS